MNNAIEKIKVILTQAVTYIVLAGLLLTIVVEELGDYADNPAVGTVIKVAGTALTVLGVAGAIIRRVTPVLAEDRGIVPNTDA